LLAAKVQYDKSQHEVARGSLQWVADNATEAEYRTIARLRLAGVLLDEKKHDDALRQLERADAPEFQALVQDRRGDILLAQGKNEEAKAAYRKAWDAMAPQVEYRRIIDAKLTALGASPQAIPSSETSAAASAAESPSPSTSAGPASAAPPTGASVTPASSTAASETGK
jgi:tetratricopeptide (TPR) repeat protein